MEREAEWICEGCKKVVHRVQILDNSELTLWMLRPPLACGWCGKTAFPRERRKEEGSEEDTQAAG